MDDQDDYHGIAALEERVNDISVDDPQRAEALNELAKALWRAALARSDEVMLERAISTIQDAVDISRNNTPSLKLAGYLNNLGLFLQDLAPMSGDPTHLEQSLRALEEGVLCAPAALKSILLLNLGGSLRTLNEFQRDKSILDKSISVFRDGLESRPSDSSRPKLLNGLAASLLDRFNTDPEGDTYDLQQALDFAKEAVDTSTDDHPYRAVFLDTYGVILEAVFSRQPSTDLLQESITYGTMAVELASSQHHPKALQFAINLAESLRLHHRIDSSSSSLDEALDLLTRSLQDLPGDPRASNYGKWSLSLCLLYRFDRDGNEMDLDACVRMLTSICDATPKENPRWIQYRATLGEALIHRFDFSSSADHLDQAVDTLKDAASHVGENDQFSADSTVQIDLSVALLARFDLRGSSDDLNSASAAAKAALDLLDVSSADYTLALVALANTYLRAYQETEDEAILDRAIEVYQEVVDHECVWESLRPGRLYVLSYALQLRYAVHRDHEDWERCLRASQESVRLSENHRTCYISIGQMGNVFLARAQADESRPEHAQYYLEQAVSHLTQALALMPESDSRRALWLNNLGLSYELLSKHKSGDVAACESALYRYQEAAELDMAPALQRVTAAYRAIVLLAGSTDLDLQRASYFCRLAIQLLPTLSPRHLQRQDQQNMISMFSGLGSYSAAVLLAAGYTPGEAVRALETTRGVMNSLLIDTRTDMTLLKESDPGLAAEFDEISSILDNTTSDLPDPNGIKIQTRDPEARIRAAKAFDNVVARIRLLHGFGGFLMAPTDEQLQSIARNSYIIIVNVSALRSDALIIQHDGIWNISLPGLTLEAAADNANKLSTAIDNESTGAMDRIEVNQVIREVLSWLWNTLVRPVLRDIPPASSIPHQQQQHRICWIPTSALTNLPIHAATDSTNPKSNAMDLIISSYSVTVKSLRHAHSKLHPHPHSAPHRPPPAALLVAMQQTPNHTDLPFALDEVTSLQRLLTPAVPTISVLSNPPLPQQPPQVVQPPLLTHQTFLTLLTSPPTPISILHLSCHGLIDPTNPSQSRLLLPDHNTHPLTVSDIAAQHLPAARLAYLSACHAAAGPTPALLDEGIHLAGAFQLAGFPQVVGTLWQVSDRRAGQVSRGVWGEVIRVGGGDREEGGEVVCYERVAEGVNLAVRGLREDTKMGGGFGGGEEEEEEEDDGVDIEFEDDPFSWATFVYMGL